MAYRDDPDMIPDAAEIAEIEADMHAAQKRRIDEHHRWMEENPAEAQAEWDSYVAGFAARGETPPF